MKFLIEIFEELVDFYISLVKGTAILGIAAMVMLTFLTSFDNEEVNRTVFNLQLVIGICLTFALVSVGFLAALTSRGGTDADTNANVEEKKE